MTDYDRWKKAVEAFDRLWEYGMVSSNLRRGDSVGRMVERLPPEMREALASLRSEDLHRLRIDWLLNAISADNAEKEKRARENRTAR